VGLEAECLALQSPELSSFGPPAICETVSAIILRALDERRNFGVSIGGLSQTRCILRDVGANVDPNFEVPAGPFRISHEHV
jgi:hypothetical protein